MTIQVRLPGPFLSASLKCTADTAKFLSPAERTFIQQRLRQDQDGLSSEYKTKFVLQGLLDWKIWAFSWVLVIPFVYQN